MSYATWRKCDFQIHTPRDPNWTGQRPPGIGDLVPATGLAATAHDVDTARQIWAVSFVDKCVERGLGAIAITDHHEMFMVPYVQREISTRQASDPDFGLWLFPGMELTATGGKQCLILFDADLSEDWWKQAQGKLSIAYAALDEKAARSPALTQLAYSYADIADELDTVPGLKGKFIVLPNVSQGNSHTVLVDKAHADFRKMACVGGYLDNGQTIATMGSKNIKRLSGEDPVWSTRRVYPLPTSDSRSHDFAALGTNDTWIKLAEPTAEAIRQAFLGHHSRIRIMPPQLPALVVSSIDFEGSSILSDTSLSLSPEFNAIIGGRGSGKSSFLEYLSFGLGRSCFDLKRDPYSSTQRMHDLINDTLITQNAKVTVAVVQDNAVFRVVRGPGTSYQPQITYPNGSTQLITTKELRALFPAVVYSQGELAEIGKQAGKHTQLSDLLQFVNADYKREDDKLILDTDAARNSVRSSIQLLVANWSRQSQLHKLTMLRDSLSQRVVALEKTLPARSETDQATVDLFDKAEQFESKRIQASKHADQMLSELEASATELLNERDLSHSLPGKADEIRSQYAALFKTFSSGLATLHDDISKHRAFLATAETSWEADYKAARAARDAVLDKFSAHRTVTAQIIKLREEIVDATNQIGDLEADIHADGDPSGGLRAALKSLRDLNSRRNQRITEWAQQIETLSNGKIRAVVEAAGDLADIRDALETLSNKTGSQEATRLRALEDALETTSAIEFLDQLRAECLALLHWRQVGSASGEEAPSATVLFTLLGDTERIRTTFLEKLDAVRVEAIAVSMPKPRIGLSYTDGSREIAFEKASEGQRAAALLFMLLEQPGGPLIIDQPEGDLDNKIIADLTEKLHSAKQKRQLLFASHNANIVVNGSSELVGHLDVNVAGERRFECSGAIESSPICAVITSTMEGGEKAFKDRQDKYGY
ncbi:AAA family ATPase [Phyllobacterium sp. 0TCS1.6C]|uniref:TrlF family AAA-like ATPase n=1 Tax=unclassified Phyllobacterium TaxID=2638441 RepID=UPI00226449B2|nr:MULTISPECIES: AAA family ATPase [unclassified Phyllobacterium]MCX8281779.1 AAA family ATPase [Phyllobacterium sp. 0TCS1.6C]MCX8295314.1 AAA family ATPase [Phyllobacterium sp. 0TCS1.6A]